VFFKRFDILDILKYIQQFYKGTCPIQAPNIPCTVSHLPFPLFMLYQMVSPGPRFFFLWIFRNNIRFYGEELLAPLPTPKLGDRFPWLLVQYIRSYPPYWRPFLRPQLEDAACRGDKRPACYYLVRIFFAYILLSTNIKINMYRTMILPVCFVWVWNLVADIEGGT